MSSLSLPADFSWLSRAYRPSRDEVRTYAELIAAQEGCASDGAEAFQREAELQLWVWRNENRRRPPRRHSRPPA